jgi:hypothetical protein
MNNTGRILSVYRVNTLLQPDGSLSGTECAGRSRLGSDTGKKGDGRELEQIATVEEGAFRGDISRRVLGRWETTIILITNEVGLGMLSLPAALQTLGLIPGMIAIVGLGILTGYTAYVLLQFYRRYPDIANIADCGRKIGGRWLEAFVGVAFVINLCLTCASAGLTMSIALNSMSDHALCTVGFIAFPIMACWALCIPRSLEFVAQMGIPSTVSIVAAVIGTFLE